MRHDGPLSSLCVLASICFGPLQLSSLSSLSRCQLSFSWPRIFPLPLSFLIPHIISSQTLPILIQSKTITLRYSLQVRISSDDVRLWPIRSLNIDQWEAPACHGPPGRVPGADQHNQCYQCRDWVLLSTNDLTLLTPRPSQQRLKNNFILNMKSYSYLPTALCIPRRTLPASSPGGIFRCSLKLMCHVCVT